MSPLLSHAADAVFPVGSLAVMCQLQDQPSEDHTRALMARLDDFLDAGRTTVFVDMARLSVEPPGLRLALARWGSSARVGCDPCTSGSRRRRATTG